MHLIKKEMIKGKNLRFESIEFNLDTEAIKEQKKN